MNSTHHSDDHDPLDDYPDVVRAIEEAPLTGKVKLPEGALFRLERARREALAARRAAEGLADAAPAARPQPIRRPARLPLWLAAAAAVALLVAVGRFWLPGGGPVTARVTITSPGDTVFDTRPTIAWTSKDAPGQKYDVWILPESAKQDTAPATSLFVVKGVTSPVSFDQLKPGAGSTGAAALAPGTGYQVLVCLADAGPLAGVPVPFRVAP